MSDDVARPGRRDVPEAVAELPDVPGNVSMRPDVLAARANVVAARDRLTTEAEGLQRTARETFDIRARIRRAPQAAQEDPARAAALAGIAAGAAAGVTALVRRARRPRRPALLPPEVEAVVSKLGKNSEKVRRSLEEGFAAYLKDRGFEQRSRRGRLASAIGSIAVPVGTQVARQALRRAMAPPPEAVESQAPEGSRSKDARSGR